MVFCNILHQVTATPLGLPHGSLCPIVREDHDSCILKVTGFL